MKLPLWPRTSWFRFSLRSLLVLTAFAGLGIAWWIDRQQLEQRIQTLEEEFRPRGITGASWGIEQVTGPPNTTGAKRIGPPV